MTATASLVLRGLAQRAADQVVAADLKFPKSAKLFRTSPPTVSEETAVRAQLVELHASVLGQVVSPDTEAINEAYALFADARSAGGEAEHAWKLVVFALLQHPRQGLPDVPGPRRSVAQICRE